MKTKTIKIKDKKLKEILEMYDRDKKAAENAIRVLSEVAFNSSKRLWNTINAEYPETNNDKKNIQLCEYSAKDSVLYIHKFKSFSDKYEYEKDLIK